MKKSTAVSWAAVSAATMLLGSRSRRAKTSPDRQARIKQQARLLAAQSSQRYLMYVIVPAWSAAGALDWLWHRQTRIETTSGPKESLMWR